MLAASDGPLIEIISRDNFTMSSASVPSEDVPDLLEFTACLWFKLQTQNIQVCKLILSANLFANFVLWGRSF